MGRMKGEEDVEAEGGETVRCVSCSLYISYVVFCCFLLFSALLYYYTVV